MSDWKIKAANEGGVRIIKNPGRPRNFKVKKQSKCKALECLICTCRFTLDDILDGTYCLETFICSHCYKQMQDKPYEQSCFGKPSQMINGKKLLGYEPNARTCSQICPDREVCKRIVRPDLIENYELTVLV